MLWDDHPPKFSYHSSRHLVTIFFFLMVRIFKIYLLSHFWIHDTVLTIGITWYLRSTGMINFCLYNNKKKVLARFLCLREENPHSGIWWACFPLPQTLTLVPFDCFLPVVFRFAWLLQRQRWYKWTHLLPWSLRRLGLWFDAEVCPVPSATSS